MMGTRQSTRHLVCLRLPGNVEREVNRLRQVMFRESGAASTQAIPPILPLAYSDGALPDDAVGRLPQTEILPLAIGPPVLHASTVVLHVPMDARWSAWIESSGLAGTAGPPPDAEEIGGWPAPLRGVFLGASDLADQWTSLEKRIARDPERRALASVPERVRVVNVALLTVRTSSPVYWWQDVEWQIEWTVRIKLRGQAVAT